MKKHIHIFGASGAGVTTLGKALSRELDYHFMDTDDFYWAEVLPKYSVTHPIDERIQLMTAEMDQHDRQGWVNSGSLTGWGDCFIPRYDLAIFIYTAPEERLRRLKIREYETFVAAMLPGGDMYDHVQEFFEFAASYDTADIEASGRNFKKHQAWFNNLTCPLLKLDGAKPPEQLLSQAMAAIKN